MKKQFYLLIALLVLAGGAWAQNWTVYEANELPEAASPAWEESNNSNSADITWTIQDDPEFAGNKVVAMHSLTAGQSGMYKTANFDPNPGSITVVLRTKLDNPAAERVTEMDIHVGGLRDQLIIRANNTINLQRSGGSVDLTGTLDVTQWNTFRVTLDAATGIVNVYLNEGAEPVLVDTTATSTNSMYIRFGDGNGTPTYSSLLDFVAYDTTGAFSPVQQALPAGLVPVAAPEWVVYEANELPEAATPMWEASNNSNSADITWSVQDDPDFAGNKVLAMQSLTSGQSGMYKTPNFDPDPKFITAVMRVKLDNPAAERLTEMDMHLNGLRDQLIIRANNTINLQRSGGSVDLTGTLDVTEWNVFRITLDGTSGVVKVYLNEQPEPVLVDTTTTTTTSKYIRFGDGNSSPTYSALHDFVVYSVDGAFSPTEFELPDGLIPGQVDNGNWAIYDANELPDGATPAWEASNNSNSADITWTVQDDPDFAGNKVLAMQSLTTGQSGMYKTADFDPVPTAITVVLRAKLDNPAAERVTEMDMHINGLRDQLIIRANNTISLQRSGGSVDLSGTLDVTQWNVYRITLEGATGIVKVYLNEDAEPVLVDTTTTSTTANYIRFGDGNSTPTYSSLLDFVAYDVTGALDPTQQPLPEGLIPIKTVPVGEWSIYAANELPEAANPAWEASNNGNSADITWAIVDDPDVTGNKLLSNQSLTSGQAGMYKTANFDPDPKAITITLRAKLDNAAAERVTEMDMHLNGLRDQLIIRANNTINLQRSGGSVDLTGTLDVTKWNVFRVTLDATSGEVKVYLNENETPVLIDTTTTTTTSKYIRFGDGNGSPTYSALIDFVTYDTTGAYSPAESALPAGLIPGTEEPTEDAAHLSDLTIDGTTVTGFSPASFAYTVQLPYGTTAVPTVAATALYPNATVEITAATALPGTTSILVTGAGALTQTYEVNFTIAPNTDASLSAITVNGTAIAAFDPEVTTYEVPVPVGTTEIPTIVATTTDPNATFTVRNASALPGFSYVDVTAEDGSTTRTYQLNLVLAYSTDATLASVSINSEPLAGFDPDDLEYDVMLSDFEVPGILVTTTHPAAIAFVNYPAAIPGVATIDVVAEDGETELVYTINFTTTAVALGADRFASLKVYPNPVVSHLVIGGAADLAEVKLLGMDGSVKMTKTNSAKAADLTMDVTHLPQGIYLVRIETITGVVITRKVTK